MLIGKAKAMTVSKEEKIHTVRIVTTEASYTCNFNYGQKEDLPTIDLRKED